MNNRQKVLVVDDDSIIRELIQLYLEDEYDVVNAEDGVEAIEKAKEVKPALILLDIMLPYKNGWEVCKEIRSFSQVPIIMVSAKGEEIDKVLGLELGADDYIVKPFSPRELTARVKAQIRRSLVKLDEELAATTSLEKDAPNTFTIGKLSINLKNYKVLFDNNEIELTAKEFELLLFLAQSEGQVFSREQLLNKVWGFNYSGDSRAVDSTIKRLRKKLEQEDYIQTIWGIGYKLEVP